MPASLLLSRLQRVTSSGKFISEIDGLRFIAIGTVVLFHIHAHPFFNGLRQNATAVERVIFEGVINQGFHGVQLFFVISGFILGLPFASYYLKGKSKVNLKEYFIRRVTRLEPPYIICMVGLFFVLVLFKGMNAMDLFPNLIASLGYVHNVIFAQESLINNVAWSLEIEIQFYVLVPLLTTIFAVKNTLVRRSILIGICILSVCGHWLVFSHHNILSLTVLNHLHFFLIGFLLADVFLFELNERPTRSYGWDIVSIVGWPLLFFVWNLPLNSVALFPFLENRFFEVMMFPVLVFALYYAVFRGKITNFIFTAPLIVTIGGMCYSIYLLHNYIIGFTMRLTASILPNGPYGISFLLQSVIIIPVMLLICTLYYVVIERPCMDKRWPQRLAAKFGFVPTSNPTRNL